jgi:hypothetical protein
MSADHEGPCNTCGARGNGVPSTPGEPAALIVVPINGRPRAVALASGSGEEAQLADWLARRETLLDIVTVVGGLFGFLQARLGRPARGDGA